VSSATRSHPDRSGDDVFLPLRAVLECIDPDADAERLARSVLEALASVYRVEGAALLVRDTNLGFVSLARHGAASEQPVLNAIAARVCDAGQPTVAESPEGWSGAAPLRVLDRTVGVLALQRGHSVSPSIEVLEVLGRQVGAALEGARRCSALRDASGRAEALTRVSGALAGAADLSSVLPTFAAEMRTLETFDRLACGFVNDTGDYLEVTTSPAGSGWGFGSVLPVVGSGLGAALLNGRPVLQADLVHEHRFIEDLRLLEEGIRSYLVLPLISRGRSIGVLALGRREGTLTLEAADRLETVVAAAALVLENLRLLQKTRDLAITDEVTPLFNFRFFHQILDRELKLVDRYKSVLSLIFMDLDRFKPINDQYGHLRGSRVLREVGFLLRAAVRETDYPSRYGGDEFVVILPQTDGAAARTLADKLRRLIEEHHFLQEEGINAQIGCSLGVATYPNDAATKEALIRLADERMYGDKDVRKKGR
jgi:diguanylate cyclase (GGDEF)-like protein